LKHHDFVTITHAHIAYARNSIRLPCIPHTGVHARPPISHLRPTPTLFSSPPIPPNPRKDVPQPPNLALHHRQVGPGRTAPACATTLPVFLPTGPTYKFGYRLAPCGYFRTGSSRRKSWWYCKTASSSARLDQVLPGFLRCPNGADESMTRASIDAALASPLRVYQLAAAAFLSPPPRHPSPRSPPARPFLKS
jgi:hypothetical protein